MTVVEQRAMVFDVAGQFASWHASWSTKIRTHANKKTSSFGNFSSQRPTSGEEMVNDVQQWFVNNLCVMPERVFDVSESRETNESHAVISGSDRKGHVGIRDGRAEQITSERRSACDESIHSVEDQGWSEIVFHPDDYEISSHAFSEDDDCSISNMSLISSGGSISILSGSGYNDELLYSHLKDDESTVCSSVGGMVQASNRLRQDSELRESSLGSASVTKRASSNPPGSHPKYQQETRLFQKTSTSSISCESGSKRKSSHSKARRNPEATRTIYTNKLQNAMADFGRYDVRCATILSNIGQTYEDTDQSKVALQFYQQALRIFVVKMGDHSPESLDTKVQIGRILLSRGKLEEAMETYYEVICMKENLLGEMHVSVSDLHLAISNIFRSKGQPEKAVKETKKALRGYRETYGDEHDQVVVTIEEIASIYTEMGQHERANAILTQVVKLRAAVSGESHPDVAKSLIKLALSFQSLGDSTKALKTIKKAYSMQISNEGGDSEVSMATLESIGKLYLSIGQNDKAVKTFTKLLTIRKRKLGKVSPSVAKSFVSLGVALREAGQVDRAMKLLKHAMSIYVNCNGLSDYTVEMVEVLSEIGTTHQAKGELADAAKAFYQEMAGRKRIVGRHHKDIADTLNRIGSVEHERGKCVLALQHFMKALTIYEKTEGRNSSYASTLVNAGLVLDDTGNKESANEAYIEAVVIYREEGLDDDHPILAEVISYAKKGGHTCCCTKSKCNSFPCKSRYIQQFSC